MRRYRPLPRRWSCFYKEKTASLCLPSGARSWPGLEGFGEEWVFHSPPLHAKASDENTAHSLGEGDKLTNDHAPTPLKRSRRPDWGSQDRSWRSPSQRSTSLHMVLPQRCSSWLDFSERRRLMGNRSGGRTYRSLWRRNSGTNAW